MFVLLLCFNYTYLSVSYPIGWLVSILEKEAFNKTYESNRVGSWYCKVWESQHFIVSFSYVNMFFNKGHTLFSMHVRYPWLALKNFECLILPEICGWVLCNFKYIYALVINEIALVICMQHIFTLKHVFLWTCRQGLLPLQEVFISIFENLFFFKSYLSILVDIWTCTCYMWNVLC